MGGGCMGGGDAMTSDRRSAPARAERGDRERGRSPPVVDFDSELPQIAYVSDVARWLRTTEKAVRDRVRRDQLPRPGRMGKRLAWSRALLLDWAREVGRVAGTP